MAYEHLSPVERLIALAGQTRVESYSRRTKSGKTVHVDAHMRSVADMPNMDLFREYQSLTKEGSTDPQSRNRQQQIINEIRKRQEEGSWGHSDAGAQTRAQNRVDKSKGATQRGRTKARQEFEQNKAAPAPEVSDKEYEEHVKRIREILDSPKAKKLDTQKQHGIWGWQMNEKTGKEEFKPVPGLYKPERAEQHRKIIQDILDSHSHVPAENKAVMSGGLGGAGKGYVLKQYADIDKDKYITIDPDEMKQELLTRGMVPEVDGLMPMEHAALIHEESSDLANLLHQVAMKRGLNVILDTTMASVPSTKKKAQKFLDKGYEVEAVFVDVPVEVSITSALGRHRGGVDRFRGAKDELGGRFVPPEYLQGARPEPGSPYQSKNRGAFEALKGEGIFTRTRVYDNSDRSPGSSPKLVSDETHTGGEEGSTPSKTSQVALENLKKKTGANQRVSLSAVDRLLALSRNGDF